jgi:Ca2+-binding RTX toxin-like protein
MALTQEQVDAWFDANPNATAEEVAAAVQSVGGLAANEGLASMIANRYAIAEPEVTNYYNTWAGVPVEDKTAKIDTKVDLPAFTDTIFTGTPTTQEELLSVLADSTVTGGTGNDTIVGATGVDTVVGGTGNDTVVSGTGEDTVAGSTTQTQAVANPFAAITAAWTNGDYAATNAIIASSNLTADDIQSYYNLDDYTMDWVLRQGIKTADQVSTVTGATGNDTVVGATGNDTVTGVTAADTVVGATGNDTVVGATGNDATYTAGNWPTIISGTTGTDGDVLTTTTTSDGTPFYLHDASEGVYYQNPATVESYAPFTGADGKTYYAIYAPVFSSGKAWNETPITGYMTEAQFRAFQGGSTMGDAFQNILNSPVGSFGLGLLGPYGQLINAANAASKDDWLSALVSGIGAAQGFGVTDLGGFDIKTVKNTASVLNAVDKKNLAAAFTAGSDLIGGVPGDYKTLGSLASATLALKNNDTAGFLNSLGDLTGSSDAKVAAAAVKLRDIFESGNTSQLNSALNNFSAAVNGTATSGTDTSSTLTTLSAEDLKELNAGELKAYEDGGIQGLSNFRKDMKLLNSLTSSGYTGDSLGGDYTDTSTITGAAGNDVTLPTGVQLASVGDGVFKTDVGGVPTYAESANASSITAPLGYKLLSTSEVENKPEGSYYDITANAWFKPDTAVTDLTGDATIQADAALFNNSLGTLDELDTTRSADEFADFLATLGITNTTQLTDSGLSNQDILDMINALDDTVTVTGAKGNDTVTGAASNNTVTGATSNDGLPTVTVEACKDGKVRDPITGECVLPTTINDIITGGDGNDNVPTVTVEACKDGKVRDPITGECVFPEEIPTVTVEECKDGKVRDPVTGECVLPTVIIEDCKDGKVRDPVTGECVLPTVISEECKDGKVRDPITGECVLPTVIIEACKDGKVRDPVTGECVLPEVVVEECKDGKVRDPITGECVLPTTGLDCKPGFVPNEAGTECIPVINIEACKDGKVRDPVTGECVFPKTGLDCPEGYVPNEAGTECIAVINVEACKDGKVRDPITGECVLPKVECDDGFHDDGTGFCVPNDEECADGYERIGGDCVMKCQEGYIRNLATGVCEKVETKECLPGQVKNAEGKCVPIVKPPPPPIQCPTGFKLVNGACVPITTTTPTYTTGASGAQGEKIDPIYAGGMDDFNLLATLEELLSNEAPKKDTKKSKDKTKMATGGHLDDLLAEQMTVDDLLKLLR